MTPAASSAGCRTMDRRELSGPGVDGGPSRGRLLAFAGAPAVLAPWEPWPTRSTPASPTCTPVASTLA